MEAAAFICRSCGVGLTTAPGERRVVRLHPCGCTLCKDCLIRFLTLTRLQINWQCPICRQAVVSHDASRSTTSSSTATATATTSSTKSNNQKRLPTNTGKSSRKVVRRRMTNFTFEERMQSLARFKAKFGHINVPSNYYGGDGLYDWTKYVRSGGKKITPEQRKRLDDMGFRWEMDSVKKKRQWEESFGKLKAYKERFGDCFVPWQWAEDKSLSEWVHTQRKIYRKGELKDNRREALEDIGFSWRGNKKHRVKPNENSSTS